MTLRRSKKRNFQLLEIMVAAFIILICAAPAIRIYTSTFLQQQDILKDNQSDHLSHLIHANIIEKLYKKDIPFQDILDKKRFSVDSSELQKQLQRFGFDAFYSFERYESKKREKKDKKPSMYLVSLKITIVDKKSKDKKDYNYKIFIDVSGQPSQLQKNIDEENIPIEEIDDSEDEINSNEAKLNATNNLKN